MFYYKITNEIKELMELSKVQSKLTDKKLQNDEVETLKIVEGLDVLLYNKIRINVLNEKLIHLVFSVNVDNLLTFIDFVKKYRKKDKILEFNMNDNRINPVFDIKIKIKNKERSLKFIYNIIILNV